MLQKQPNAIAKRRCKALIRNISAKIELADYFFLKISNERSTIQNKTSAHSFCSYYLQKEKFKISTSGTAIFGIAQYKTEVSLENILILVDAAMYKAKTEGRNKFVLAE